MEGTYGVYFGKQCAGKVQVIRQGLYYRVICRCILTGDVICRLQASCGSNREDLGIVVPEGDGFGIDTKIPVKRLGEGTMAFELIPKHDAIKSRFVPICPEEPFSYIARLKEGFLQRKHGQTGIVFLE